jgi:hypothetical protein
MTMRVCVAPADALWYGVIWEVFAPPGDGADKDHRRRTIAAVNDGGRWGFEQSGKPFEFEQPQHYAARRIRDRFHAGLLETYLSALGAPALRDDIFPETVEALHVGTPPHAHLAQTSLEDARARRT